MAGEHDVKDIADLRPGDHICFIYNSEEEHRALFAPYLRQGLEHNEKVSYIVDAHTADEVLAYLVDEGMKVEPYLETGQLAALTIDDTYMKEGSFDPDGMIRLLRGETEQALSEGYSALRITGEMSWALKGLPGSEKLMEYEAKLNDFFPDSKCLSICQYDRRRFSPEVLLDVLTTHPIAVVGTEIYDYIPPHEYLRNKLPQSTLDHWIVNLSVRKKVDEEVKRWSEMMNNILESISDGFFSLDQDLVVNYFNDAAEKLLGRRRDKVIGRRLFDAFPEAAGSVFEEKYIEVLQEKKQLSFETYFGVPPFKDWYDVRVYPYEDGISIYFQVTTERKRVEEELERGRRLIFSTLEVLPATICLLAPDYYLRFANRLFRETFGDPEGKACYEILHDRSSPCEECLPLGVLESGEPLTREWSNPQGKYFIVHYHPFEDEYGSKLVLEMGIDITERKRMEEALEMINRELGAYAQVVSHDLRAPISVIQGAGFTLDELMEGCRDHVVADQAREITEIIKKSSRNAEALIESLLDLAKAGQIPTRITEVDVKRTVEAVCEEKSAIIEEKGVRIVMVEDMGLVMAEPTHIYQIFSNLIGNALRYNDNPEPELRISYRREEGGVHRYSVSDNGPGIRTEDLERIFDPLFKGKGGGTGIGLSIARKIAGIYGGDIKAYNDGGACFEFTIKDFRQER